MPYRIRPPRWPEPVHFILILALAWAAVAIASLPSYAGGKNPRVRFEVVEPIPGTAFACFYNEVGMSGAALDCHPL